MKADTTVIEGYGGLIEGHGGLRISNGGATHLEGWGGVE